MMKSKRLKSLFRGAGRNALDLPVAGLSALAAAFAAFAVPQDILSRAVVATGLPSILAAAQPPLGLTARVGLAVGGAAIVFGLVFLLLRLLDRSGMSGTAEESETERQSHPRVRRRDGHPDAPAPRPISAARDLGEPLPPRGPRAGTPIWLDEAVPAAGPAFEAEPDREPAPGPEPEQPVPLWSSPEAVAEPEAVVMLEPEPAPVAEPVPEAMAEPVAEPRPAPPVEAPASLQELMARLEHGLARRRMATPAVAVPASPPQVFPEAPVPVSEAVLETSEAQAPPESPGQAEDRLQSAIASLQRLAARAS